MSDYTLRRTYLLNRAAWALLGLALLYAIFGGADKSWWIVIGCAVIAALLWLVAGRIEKKRGDCIRQMTDDDGNARPNKL